MPQFTSNGQPIAFDDIGPAGGASGGAGPWVCLQSQGKLAAAGLVWCLRTQANPLRGAGPPRARRKRQATRSGRLFSRSDGRRHRCPSGPPRGRARGPYGLFDGREAFIGRRPVGTRTISASHPGWHRRQAVRNPSQDRRHGPGDGNGRPRIRSKTRCCAASAGFADEQGEDRLALAALVRSHDAPFERAALSALTMPTLVVAGTRDDLAGDPEDWRAPFPTGVPSPCPAAITSPPFRTRCSRQRCSTSSMERLNSYCVQETPAAEDQRLGIAHHRAGAAACRTKACVDATRASNRLSP